MTIEMRSCDLAQENASRVLIKMELNRERNQKEVRLTHQDVLDLGPAGAMGVFTLSAFGEDADRDGFEDKNDSRGYDSEYLSPEDGALISDLYGKTLVGTRDAENGAVDRKGAIYFSCQAELGMAKKVNRQNGRRNLVMAPNTLTPTFTGRRIYIRPK